MKSMLMAIMAVVIAVAFSAPAFAGDEVFRRRFWLTLLVSLPVVATSAMIMDWFGYSLDFRGMDLVGPVFGTALFVGAGADPGEDLPLAGGERPQLLVLRCPGGLEDGAEHVRRDGPLAPDEDGVYQFVARAAWIPTLVIGHEDGRFTRLEGAPCGDYAAALAASWRLRPGSILPGCARTSRTWVRTAPAASATRSTCR